MLLSKAISAFKSRPAFGSGLDATKHLHKIAAVAIILRQNKLTNDTEMLFIKRSMNERDIWSGDIAYPGGCHESGDGACGFDTVCREVQEEIGLNLRNQIRYQLIGTLNDRTIARGSKHLTIIPFIFIDSAPVFENEYRINGSEISCLWWENVDKIDENFNGIRDRYFIDIEKRFLARFARKPLYYHSIKYFLRSLWISSCSFPCIKLSGAALFVASNETPVDISGEATSFSLWGLTMSMFNEVMAIVVEKKNPYLTNDIKFDNVVFDAHFHCWQYFGLSWRNSLVASCISYFSSIIALLFSLFKVVGFP